MFTARNVGSDGKIKNFDDMGTLSKLQSFLHFLKPKAINNGLKYR